MARPSKSAAARPAQPNRSVTIKDLASELSLSITTISRALNGYPDVGDATRERIEKAAARRGYRPNRNAQRLVTRRTHSFAWVQSDNDRKFADPHFVEVMAGVLRGARAGGYDIVLTSHTPGRELAVYDRYVSDNSVDGFIIDLPRENDPRVDFLLRIGQPFVVHGRAGMGDTGYSWVDIDNFANFYRLTRLMIANGHRRIAFINGDETFAYAQHRRHGVMAAVADAGLPASTVKTYNSVHPMGDAGYKLTARALKDTKVTAMLYSSSLMAVEGHAAMLRDTTDRALTVATMDDELHYIDLTPFAGEFTYVRSSLRAAGEQLIAELMRQCETGGPPGGHVIPSSFHVAPGLDRSSLGAAIPAYRAASGASGTSQKRGKDSARA